MVRLLTFLIILGTHTAFAQFIGAGFTRAHENNELRLSFGNRNQHHEWQAFLEVFLNPTGETQQGAYFEGKRFAFDSLDRVGGGGRYAYHWFGEQKRVMPYAGFETQLAPTGMRLSLQQSDGSFQDVYFRNTFYWDNYLLLGCRIRLFKTLSLDIDGGLGLVRIFGIPDRFTIQTKSGVMMDNARYFSIGLKYFPKESRWR